jgi:hypothetical protein
MSIDPVLASTSVRTRSMSFGAPALAGSETAPEVYRPSGAASGGDASAVTAALSLESRVALTRIDARCRSTSFTCGGRGACFAGGLAERP